jgi:putative flippase GtrA
MVKTISRIASPEFLRFAAVGVLGFIWDTATVYTTKAAIGLYGAGVAGYVVAASANWVFNRLWTFRGRAHDALHRQWARFLLLNLGGFVLNRGTYAVLIATEPVVRAHPVLAVAAGALAGLGANFVLSNRYVFR